PCVLLPVAFNCESCGFARPSRPQSGAVEGSRSRTWRSPRARRPGRALRYRLQHLDGRPGRRVPARHGARVRRTSPRCRGRRARRAGGTAAVGGAGTLGWLALQVLTAAGARVLVVSRTSRRFAMAKALGAADTHAVSAGSLDGAAQQFSGREGVDLVIETAGSAMAVQHALSLVRPGGRVVLTGLPHEPTAVALLSVVRRQVTITGSMIYQDEFGEALRLLE